MLAAALFAASCLVGAVWDPPGYRSFDAVTYLLTALVSLPLAARRVAPLGVLVLTSLAYAVYLGLRHMPSYNFWCVLLAFYTVAALKPFATTAVGAALTAAVLFCSGLVAPDFPIALAVLQAVAAPAVVWVVGSLVWQLGERNRQLAVVTGQLRLEQQLRAERAVTEERLRIARELHDVVAHHMSVISLQAGLAGYLFDTDPETARTAVGTVGATSREALEEMRRLLNLLRVPEAVTDTTTADPAGDDVDGVEPEPAPGLGTLRTLIGRVRAMGIDVDLAVSGAVEDLPSGQQLAAYRVIQEALTNIIKHAGPCRATVAVTLQAGQLTVVVANDVPIHPPPAPAESGGYGLTAMRERALLYGGQLTAGPRPDGGFTVALTMPVA